MPERRIAVVLFNLGGPDAPEAIRPFLFNLFSDRAIIGVPQPLRWCLATLIAHRRAPVAREIYDQIGGRSPLLELTREQAAALEAELGDLGEVRVFVAMRYWHPMTEEAVLEVKAFAPERVVLLPLYPQFSTTTTASSITRSTISASSFENFRRTWSEAFDRGEPIPTRRRGNFSDPRAAMMDLSPL